jgi:hypothetical protein
MLIFLTLFAVVWIAGAVALYRGVLVAPEMEDERLEEARAELARLEQTAKESGLGDYPTVPERVRGSWNDPLVTFPRS